MNFTHNYYIKARYVIFNTLLSISNHKNLIIIHYATYTYPEVAQVGYNKFQLKQLGIAYDTFKANFSHNERDLFKSNDNLYKIN
jgi:pyruvate/2-oxoglutarate dehydrogenase complex dihydrolipoamide dehydrogenase (E3) component